MSDVRRQRRRILLIGCLGGVLLALAWWTYRPWAPKRPIGDGPAGPAIPREPWSRIWTTAPVRLIGIGDSVTAGFGTSPSHSYFNRLVSNPEDEFPELKGICLRAVLPNLEAVNLSISGTTSIEHVDEQLPKIEKAGPDTLGLIVMTSGGNDLIHDYGHRAPREGAMYGARLEQAKPWIANYEKRLDGVFEKLRNCFPAGCHIFIADIYDPTDGVGDIANAGLPSWPDGTVILEAASDALRRSASRFPQVHVVPMHDAFLGHGIHCSEKGGRHYRPEDPHYWYFGNLEDPNDRGYDAIRRLFLLEIAKALSDRR
jgi:lysophospholipase L1-like esterase